MKGHLTQSRIEGDGTDELPVLSDEAILRFAAAAAVEREAPARRDARPATPADDAEIRDRPEHRLETSLETLRATLEAAERRWQALEQRLKTQDRAIAELRTALRRPPDRPAASRAAAAHRAATPPAATPPAATQPAATQSAATQPAATQPASTRSAATQPARPREEAVSDVETRDDRAREAQVEDRNGGGERELLERIAALETYIAGRADRWREMEQEVDAKCARIAELEAELNQRIAREQQLEERLHNQGGRAEALRDKLRRMHRRLEHAASTRPDRDLESTSELAGPAGEVPSIVFDTTTGETRAPALDASESNDAPELVCLSSNLGERYVMNKEAITIGRAADCDIQIPADFVSRQHARIRREDADMYIEDVSSTNGVYVNAVRVRRKALADGDEITIGESRFRFVSSPPH